MRVPAFAVALLALAGCLSSPSGPAAGVESSSSTSSTSVVGEAATATATLPPPGDHEVEVAGTLYRIGGFWAANLTAHNVGQHTLGWMASYCNSPPGWTARLNNASGERVAYRGNETYMGCPSTGGAMPPGAWLNWTGPASDDEARRCNIHTVCDHIWDGRIRECDGCSASHPAPPGDYAWAFTFTYHDEPGQEYLPPRSPHHQANVTLQVAVA